MKKFAIATTLVALFASNALAASSIVTWSFQRMAGVYNGGSSLTVNAQNVTIGDISRDVPVLGTAEYDPGWMSLATSADLTMNLTVTNITTTTADGTGSFTFTDADGTTFSGSLDGTWQNLGGTAFFNANVSAAQFANGATFDGPSGGSFSTSFFAQPPFGGSSQTLTFTNWFTNAAGTQTAFNNSNTQVTGSITPVPGAALLGMVGFGAVSWIRRRLA